MLTPFRCCNQLHRRSSALSKSSPPTKSGSLKHKLWCSELSSEAVLASLLLFPQELITCTENPIQYTTQLYWKKYTLRYNLSGLTIHPTSRTLLRNQNKRQHTNKAYQNKGAQHKLMLKKDGWCWLFSDDVSSSGAVTLPQVYLMCLQSEEDAKEYPAVFNHFLTTTNKQETTDHRRDTIWIRTHPINLVYSCRHTDTCVNHYSWITL